MRRTCAASRKQHPAVPEKLRGTFAGLATPEVIEYVKSLGVTTIELLPIHSVRQRQPCCSSKGLTNYWGYNTHRLLRARSALRGRPATQRARVQGDGGALP